MKQKEEFKYHLKNDVRDDLENSMEKDSFVECCDNCEDCLLFLNLSECGYE